MERRATREEVRGAAAKVLVLVLALAALVVALAWNDVLPGGWSLRKLVRDPRAEAERARAEHREERLALFAAENDGAPPGAIVFLGSSTIERFPLATAFPGARALDRGIADETVPELLARLDASLPRAALGGVVLYAGRVEQRRETLDADAFAARIEPLLQRLSERARGAPVLVLGMLPECDMSSAALARLERVDARLADLARARDMSFLATRRPPLTAPDGSLAESFAADRVHLNERGYAELARWIASEGGEIGRRLAP